MAARAFRRTLAVLATALAVAVAAGGLGGCGRGAEFEDRTAVVTLGGSAEAYEVDSCGRDGETVFLVARAPSGGVVQAVLGLDEDDDGVPASSGVTVDADPDAPDTRVAAFGAESWERRGGTGAPPGEMGSARLRGSRIQLSGEAVPVDAADRPVPGAAPTAFEVDARCDLDEG